SPQPPNAPDGSSALYRVRYNAGSNAPTLTDVRSVLGSGPVVTHSYYQDVFASGAIIPPGWTQWADPVTWTVERQSVAITRWEIFGFKVGETIAGFLNVLMD